MDGLHAQPSESFGHPSGGAGARAETDVLSDVLRTVRLNGALFFPMEASSPWADSVPAAAEFAGIVLPGAQHVVSYHVVVAGSCWAAVADEPPFRLESGDIFVIPHGDPYVMAHRPEAKASASTEATLTFFRRMVHGSAPAVVSEGGGGTEHAQLICGFLGCDLLPFNPILQALPRFVHLRRPKGEDSIRPLIEFALAESRRGRPGARCVLLRLSEVLFVEVIRRYLDTLPPDEIGWLSGLRDPIVGHALTLLHARPAEAWTLQRLAAESGSSRSALADRFTHVVGQPPMRYLAQWRMQLASRLLSEEGTKVARVALEVGYESESAFSRAFKKLTGTSPAGWRRRAAS